MIKYSSRFLFTLLIGLFFFSESLNSQNSKNEIYVSYGAGSVQEFASLLDDIIILPFIGGDFTIESPVGPINAGYKRNLSKHFSLGIEGSYTQFDKHYDVLGVKFDLSNTFITVMLHSDYTYNPGNVVRFYSGLSSGVTNFTQKDSAASSSETFFAFHVNAIGIKAGNTAGAFLELGFGYNGLVSGGLFVKF